MPRHDGPDLLEDRDVPKYDYITFMENMMNGGDDDGDDDDDDERGDSRNSRQVKDF